MKFDYKELSDEEQMRFVSLADSFLATYRKLGLISRDCDTDAWDNIVKLMDK